MKKYKYISSIGVIVTIILITALSLITKDKEISELEGRKLQKKPTLKNMIDEGYIIKGYIYESLTGDLFKKWDSYFSDHIYLRDQIVNTYTVIQSKANKKYINGVYLGEEGYFLTNKNPNKEITDYELEERAEYFNYIADEFNQSKVYLINLPYKSTVYEEKMPILEYISLSREYIDKLWNYVDKDKIGIIDIDKIFNDKEELFYKTDHHWNMNGVWKAYENIINEISKDFIEIGNIKTKDFYNIETYKDYFMGTDGRKAGQLVKDMDDIQVYRHKNIDDYKVYINGSEGQFFYNEHLDRDKLNSDYSVYLNGDNAEVIVENKKATNDLSIVVIGDSMDNPLIPLLAPHFSKIYSYDLRHYKDNFSDTMKNIDPDIIMFNGLSNNYINKNNDIFIIGN